MHVTDCLVPLESLRKYPLFLLPDAIIRVRVWAVNRATGMRAPADGWDCKPKNGLGTVIFSDQSAIFTGEVDEFCLPKEGGKARIVTRKDYIFEGITTDRGNTRTGAYLLTDDTAIAGTFTGDGLNGLYTVTYPSGLSCTETWEDGRRVNSIGDPLCLAKVQN